MNFICTPQVCVVGRDNLNVEYWAKVAAALAAVEKHCNSHLILAPYDIPDLTERKQVNSLTESSLLPSEASISLWLLTMHNPVHIDLMFDLSFGVDAWQNVDWYRFGILYDRMGWQVEAFQHNRNVDYATTFHRRIGSYGIRYSRAVLHSSSRFYPRRLVRRRTWKGFLTWMR